MDQVGPNLIGIRYDELFKSLHVFVGQVKLILKFKISPYNYRQTPKFRNDTPITLLLLYYNSFLNQSNESINIIEFH